MGLKGGQCLDLKTNTVREIVSTDLLTKTLAAAYDPHAQCPLWEQSILEWSCGDQTQVDFLQQWAGYCLSGLTTFQGFLFLFGGGSNGKSVFIKVLSTLMGDYSMTTSPESLMLQKRGNAATGDIARLVGARFVHANEIKQGAIFDENLIKQLTGGDTMTVRHLYEREFEFTPNLKLVISGNNKPIVKGTDWGFWRRVHLVPFENKITAPDVTLTSRLLTELSGILNWCIKGWAGCNQGYFQVPANIKRHTDEYRDEMDLVKQWMDERLQAVAGSSTKAMDLYQSFRSWQENNGHHPMTSNAFYRLLPSHLGQSIKKPAGNYYSGYVVKPW